MVVQVCGMADESIYKEVVVIGNGPSGISLSYMLAGNLPYIVSNAHPDEMLAARLEPAVGECLIHQDLGHLSLGLEGRTTNPVSLLLDALVHPCADIGLEMEPLVEWRRNGIEIDHVVLGKGPPGGSWHKMDPNILTLSLGAWMALPGLPYPYRDNTERRAFAYNVARYYNDYVQKMNLEKFFKNDVIVTKVTPLRKSLQEKTDSDTAKNLVVKMNGASSGRVESIVELQSEKNERQCPLSRALNFFSLRGRKCSKRPRECCAIKHDLSPDRKIREIAGSTNCGTTYPFLDKKSMCQRLCRVTSEEDVRVRLVKDTQNLDFSNSQVPCCGSNETTPTTTNADAKAPHWLVETFDPKTNKHTTYTCKYLVLANGASDSPNKLEISKHKRDPNWLLHDVRTLEIELDRYVEERGDNFDPVVVVGAGLSAADAVIAARARNVPVIHVFRNKSATLHKQLPENMYPEYHKVHQMMKDGGSTYSLYRAMPEYTLTDFDETRRSVTLTSPTGEEIKTSVSFTAVLIGSRPNMSFLPPDLSLGVLKNLPVDCKTNPVDIDRLTHRIRGVENLFAVGPLAGDHFVRFIPGGALAVVAEIYRCNGGYCK